MKRVLIIHGWGNERPVGHWHRLLAKDLRRQGHIVAYPQLPETELPSRDKWLAVLKVELDMLHEAGEVPDFQLDLANPSVESAAHKASKETLLVGSDLDPWLPRGLEETFAKPLDLPFKLVMGAGHFAVEEGWTPWTGVINWVSDPNTDLSVR